METSYQSVSAARSADHPALETQPITRGGYLLIALGIITMIGCLVATGCLYSQLGYTSFALGGAGVVLSILCFLLSKYACQEELLDTFTKFAPKEGDAYLIDFSKVNPANIFKIFDKGDNEGSFGNVRIRDTISFDESDKFKHNFPHKYKFKIVTEEVNDHGYNSFHIYMFTMNDEGKVESYGKVFENFDVYLKHLEKKQIYDSDLGGYLTFDHFDFKSAPTQNGSKQLRRISSSKKPSV